jgi:superfamily I DNA/RNA helicase
MMKEQLNATELTLTTTYRCPKCVVKLAQALVPDYKVDASAPEGEELTISLADIVGKVAVGDAILSRLNAPLMPLALSLLRKGVSARIEGRDIGRQLLGMVKQFRAKSIPDYIQRVESWFNKQVARYGKLKNADTKISTARDIADTLQAVADGCAGVKDIENRIYSLFQDTDSNSKPAVVLSSVHKAKGLEWERVFILNSTFRTGQGIEEDNIRYVAMTRVKRTIVFVN